MNSQLLPQHGALIEASSISASVAEDRGYRSVTSKAELKRLGFAERQCTTPALLLPLFGVDGRLWSYQARPDSPRVDGRGRIVKYETPKGTRMGIDVPPACRERLRDPSIPLIVTEGVRKADAAVSAELACIALLGVWNWRGTNERGGKAALPDWESIALNGRRVILAFDSDAMEKRGVHDALARLRAFLDSRGAQVGIAYLPGDDDKVGLDDYLAAGHSVDDLLALVEGELRPLPGPASDSDIRAEVGPYREHADGIYMLVDRNGDQAEHRLTNFTARIIADVVQDDGVERQRAFEIDARLGGRPERLRVSPSTFHRMTWPLSHLGATALVLPGYGRSDHVRTAIQQLSGDIPRRTVYQHTGWRLIDGRWFYLHAGGAIGSDGTRADFDVDLPGETPLYVLPDPPEGRDLHGAVRASLRLLDIGPDHVTVPILAAAYRAVLGTADFTVHLAGPTGAFKSEVAALAAQHFGAGLNARSLASWASTANALEVDAFHAKDALFVVDDFAPTGTAHDVARMNRDADRLLRAQGNQSGRRRLASDGTRKAERGPRGLILSTGEDTPPGASLRARMVVVEVGPTDVPSESLTAAQDDARAGHFAAALAGFLRWLAADRETRLSEVRSRASSRRQTADRQGRHKRTASAIGELYAGMSLFLDFAAEAGAIDSMEADSLNSRVEAALEIVGDGQAEGQRSSEPCELFLTLLASAISSGAAHVACIDGSAPADYQTWGWVGRPGSWTPQGSRVGWLDGGHLLLDLHAALAAANGVVRHGGEGVRLSVRTLAKRLSQRGLLAKSDPDGKRLTIRVTVQQSRRRCYCLERGVLFTEESGQSGQPSRHVEHPRSEASFKAPEAARLPAPPDREVPSTAPSGGMQSTDEATGDAGAAHLDRLAHSAATTGASGGEGPSVTAASDPHPDDYDIVERVAIRAADGL